MPHARAIELDLASHETTGGPRLVTVWPEGRTRQTVARGRYVDLVALPGMGYAPLGPSDLVDTVRAAASIDETIEDARNRRGNQGLTLHVTPAGRDVHEELGLVRPKPPENPSEARRPSGGGRAGNLLP